MKNSIHLISIIIICLVLNSICLLKNATTWRWRSSIYLRTNHFKMGSIFYKHKIQDTCFRPPICSKIGVLTSITDQLITKESALVIGMLKDSIQESVDFYAKAVLKVFLKD